MLPHLSTHTPASDVSSADFARMEANDTVNSDEQRVPSMEDILRNSPAAKLLGIKTDESLPEDTEEEVAPEKSDEETDPKETSEDAEDVTEEEQSQEATDEDKPAEDEEVLPEAALPTEEDIDWEYMVPVKINGKETHVSLEEIRKGYATDQHLSQKGREIGEQKKLIETERAAKLKEVVTIGSVLYQESMAVETDLAQKYNDIEAQIKAARDSGDSYAARELKETRDEVQEQYWAARNKRESSTKQIIEQIEVKRAEDTQAMLEKFNVDIKQEVPEFDAKLAKKIRDFALSEGISGELLNSVYDAKVVKVLNEYRKLKMAKETGVVKRKAVPTTKSVPSKKGPNQAAKAKRQDESLRTKVMSGDSSKAEQNEFLKSISSISRKT
jgi:hypothetical protein